MIAQAGSDPGGGGGGGGGDSPPLALFPGAQFSSTFCSVFDPRPLAGVIARLRVMANDSCTH